MALNSETALLSEGVAAEFLGLPASSLRAERIRNRIDHVRVGRRIYYTYEQLTQYIEKQTVSSCGKQQRHDLGRSATTGLARSQERIAKTITGVALGMIAESDRRAVSDLARTTFRRQPAASPRGSSRMKGPT